MVFILQVAVVDWLDTSINSVQVFLQKNEYKDIFIDSLHFCQKEKGMEIFACCIMTNHVHLIFRVTSDFKPQNVLGDLKKFKSKSIVKAIIENPKESRKEMFLDKFKDAASNSSNVNKYQFWQHNNKPIELWSPKETHEKISYVHNNPVKAELVYHPEEYIYSSARDYSGEKGLIKDVIVVM